MSIKKILLACVFYFICTGNNTWAQLSIHQYQSDFTKEVRRASFKKYLFDKTIKETFRGPLNYTTTSKFEDALLSATQFLIENQEVENGINKLFAGYGRLPTSTKQALLTAVYGLYPSKYVTEVNNILQIEKDPKVFSTAALYLYRINQSETNTRRLIALTDEKFKGNDTIPLLATLKYHLRNHDLLKKSTCPDITQLFIYQRLYGRKIVYSFQRWNRDYNGISILQNKDGSFAKDSTGNVLMVQQLARSASDLPYFITNGSTPQGIYSIAGIGQSVNNLIGPTTNLQSIIPFQNEYLFWREMPYDSTESTYANYQRLLPPSWQNYAPMYESYYAGLIGRRYIIIHGTTLDHSFFVGKKFYPNTPTDGCLSNTEFWNREGKLSSSEQWKLANAFVSTPDSTGLLIVVNIDNQEKAVTRSEIQAFIDKFEKNKLR